jgi:hypothetical protein
MGGPVNMNIFWPDEVVIDQHRADEPDVDRERYAEAAMLQATAKILPLALANSPDTFFDKWDAIEARWGWRLYPDIMRCE